MRTKRSSSFGSVLADVWPGFTDVMVGLLLVFVFVVTLFTITETLLSRTLSKKDTELDRMSKEISAHQAERERLSQALQKLEQLFLAQESTSEELRKLLALRTREIETALAEIAQKTAQVKEKDDQLAASKRDMTELEALLAERTAVVRDLTRILEERDQVLKTKDRTIEELTAQTVTLNDRIALLNHTISGYIAELERVNRLLSEARESESAEKVRVASLQEDIVTLRKQLDDLGRKLTDAESGLEREKEFRMRQLVELLGKKDKEIKELRELARYRSEFLARLEEIFQGVPDIKVQGDRFVFQAEVLFAPGRVDINETGKRELDKFITIYKEMEPKIPLELNLLILVQGHTDIDPVYSSRYASNWELSSARALEVVRYLIANGIPPTRLGAAGLGEFHPVALGTSREAKRLNRRIEIKITSL